MFLPEPALRLFEGDSFAAFELFHALTDRGYGLGTLQWDDRRAPRHFFLHYDVASSFSNLYEAVLRHNRTNLFAGQDTQLTQRQPPLA